jgi:hypothetical protein
MTLTSIPLPIIAAIITAVITSIIGPTVVEWVKMKFQSLKPGKDILGEAIKTDEKVDSQLSQLMEELKCDRICLSQFHNGGVYYPTGKSIKKFSIFYECTTDKTPSVKETFQNIPVSLFPKTFSLLYKDREILIPSTKNNTIDCGLFPVQGKKYKTKSFYLLSIEDLNKNFIGVLSISYYDKEHKFELEEWITLRQKIGAIGSILTDYLHDKRIKSN